MSLNRGRAATVACLLEATARKPGNVHRFADFEDVGYVDFLLSAAAIGESMERAPGRPLGATIADALAETRRLARTNTNLGMVLLLAPLAAVPDGVELREGVADVLAATTVEDAARVYEAIIASRPGGLGEVAEQDVRTPPTITLLEAMRLAAGRDGVARQYATGFADVFGLAVPSLAASLDAGRPLEAAIVATHLHLLASAPDTLIARKRGPEIAAEASRRAADLRLKGWPDTPGSAAAVAEFDEWLRADGHARNPGMTADLVTAALFVALRGGTIELAEALGRVGWSGPPR